MSTVDDLPPLAPSADAGRETQLAQSRGGERLEKTRATSGSRTGSSLEWLTENLAALLDSNNFVERHGLPLQQYRNF